MSTTLQSSNSNATTYATRVAGLLAEWRESLTAVCRSADAERERALTEATILERMVTRELSRETRVGVYFDRAGNQVIGTVNPAF